MSTPSREPIIRRALRHELEEFGDRWPWLVGLGVALIVLGVIALGAPFVMGLTTVLYLGILLLIGGAVECVGAFWTRNWSGFFLHLLAGALYAILGLMFLRRPGEALAALTLLLASLLMVSGVFRIVAAVVYRFSGWGWMLASGVISLLLGLMIWNQFPASALWVIGLFVGIEMISTGVVWLALGLNLRTLRNRIAPPGERADPTAA